MLLNKRSLQIVQLASKDEARGVISGLHVTPARTVATDGHCLIEVTHPDVDEQDFPSGSEGDEVGVKGDLAPFTIPAKSVTELIRKIPQSKQPPILHHIQLLVGATNKNGNANFFRTDLETKERVEIRKMDGEYPDTGRVKPKEPPVITVGFRPDLLARVFKTVAEAIKADGINAVTLEFHPLGKPYDAEQQFVMSIRGEIPETGQKIYGLVMPCRMDQAQEEIDRNARASAAGELFDVCKLIKEWNDTGGKGGDWSAMGITGKLNEALLKAGLTSPEEQPQEREEEKKDSEAIIQDGHDDEVEDPTWTPDEAA